MEDKEYTYTKVTYNGKQYSITSYNRGKFSGKTYVKSINPYDNSEYHWAVTSDGSNWSIYINSPGKLVKKVNTVIIDDVITLLSQLDQPIKVKIDRT